MENENKKYYKEHAVDDGQYPKVQNLVNGSQYDFSS